MLYNVCGGNGEDVYSWEIGRVCVYALVFCVCDYVCVCVMTSRFGGMVTRGGRRMNDGMTG